MNILIGMVAAVIAALLVGVAFMASTTPSMPKAVLLGCLMTVAAVSAFWSSYAQ